MKTKSKNVIEKVSKGKSGKLPFIPNAQKSAARIKAKISAKSKAKTQVGFD